MANELPKTQDLRRRLPDLNGRRVLIFGDVGIDEYVMGDVARISPEAPVPVLEVRQTTKKLGLAANVAANVRSLGGEPLLFSLVGDDVGQGHLSRLLREHGISDEHLLVDAQRATTQKMRVMSGHHHIVRVDYESRQPIGSELFQAWLPNLKKAMKETDCVIIQDYAKGLVNEDTAQALIGLARDHGKPVLVDPYRTTPLRVYRGCHFMTPNRDEAMDLAKQIPEPQIWGHVEAVGLALMKELRSPKIVITLGPEGMQLFEGSQSLKLPTFAKKVFDVTGAGDTVIAAFALAQAAGWSLAESAILANAAAGVVVGYVGAVACSQTELDQALAQVIA